MILKDSVYILTPKYHQKVISVSNNIYTFTRINLNFVKFLCTGKHDSNKYRYTIKLNINNRVVFYLFRCKFVRSKPTDDQDYWFGRLHKSYYDHVKSVKISCGPPTISNYVCYFINYILYSYINAIISM